MSAFECRHEIPSRDEISPVAVAVVVDYLRGSKSVCEVSFAHSLSAGSSITGDKRTSF